MQVENLEELIERIREEESTGMGSSSYQKISVKTDTVILQKFYQIDILVTTEYIYITWKCSMFHQPANTSSSCPHYSC